MASIADLLKTDEEKELLYTPMDMEATPPAAPEPTIADNTPQEQVFTAPKLEDILPSKQEDLGIVQAVQEPQVPMVAEVSPLSRQEQLLKDYLELSGKELQSARDKDRMLKVGGAIGDALATYINARSQMKAKVPGVQVQQGAGLGKVADMFATAPEIQSDVATRREALLKQYAELAKGERSQARLTSQEKLAREKMANEEKIARIAASKKGELTPYQEMMREIKKTEAIDRKTQKLQSDLQQSQNVATTISGIENTLGFSLDDIDESGKVNGKEVDIPGVSIPGYGRLTAYSDAARELDDTMSKLFNVELKNRSGVAVTPPELKNLKREFSEGKFNTEVEKLKAMKRFKEGLKKAFKNIEAGYPKEVVSEYQARGGFTSDRFGGTLESTQKSEKDKEVQNFADEFFNGDYDKASRFLKKREGI